MDCYPDFFTVESVAAEGQVTIRVQGEIDFATAPQLESALAAVDGQDVALDLSAVTFCDGAGVRVLDEARAWLGVHLHLRRSSASVRKVAGVLGIEWLVNDGTASDPPVR